jgi:D-sedoheptulose 7-phosphate isomerase
LNDVISKSIREHLETVQRLEPLLPTIHRMAEVVIESLGRNGKILWLGNGGSAADSQHMAAEIVGRFQKERRGLPSIALTTDSSILTALGNDYGYESVFARQVQALCVPGDVVIGISTSGNSANVVRAIEEARRIDAVTIAMTGEGGGRLAELVNLLVAVPSRTTARIQECHILIGHLLCECIDGRW